MANETEFKYPFMDSDGIQRIFAADDIRKKNKEAEASIQNYHRKYQSAPHFVIDGQAPTIPDHLLQTCQVVSSRTEILKRLPKGGTVIEVGTQTGKFARTLIDHLSPEKLYLADISYALFNDSFVEKEVQSGQVEKREGYSWNILDSFPDGHFDVIYIDAGHYYAQVARDIDTAYRKLKFGGYIILNDFTIWSPLEQVRYGIYKAACEAIIQYDLEMRYIGMHPEGYHDVALRKVSPQNFGPTQIIARDICVFNMGKVANTAITKALGKSYEVAGRRIYSFHILDRSQVERSRATYEKSGVTPPTHLDLSLEVINRHETASYSADFIIPFRNPVERNISDFFENLDLYASKEDQKNAESLVRIFLEKYPFESCNWWISTQFTKALGVDFNRIDLIESGYQNLSLGKGRALLLRAELNDELKGSIISEFLGISSLSIEKERVRTEISGEVYQEFKNSIKIDRENMNKMIDAVQMKGILSSGEKEFLRSKYQS